MKKMDLFENAEIINPSQLIKVTGGNLRLISESYDQGDSSSYDNGDSTSYDNGDSNHHDNGDSSHSDNG